ncbi:G2/M phase-specific E3 ubiquitin-protein ligase [Sinocyclocheilus grahami]|uniref:G2/M phase-specific E3 ubiquitin-protein ligase n=1 Tax=Sinocyclocheilus grahami TaxID=75366 RepID=UPI0007AD5BEC|nr:PREDICTED: G2/M phase-specific E3 ubiquitin-protein ligase-like [Sinocyclocheilus grahami]
MILKKLHSRVDLSCCPTSNQINVCRDSILQGSLQAFKRRRFNPDARLDVIFVDSDGVGEGAVDEGGPTREFLRLLMREIQRSKIFEGPEDKRLLALDTHDAGDSLYMMGALRYISSLEERDSLVQSAAEYFVNGRTNLALRQFEEGFKTLGLIDELKNHPDIFEDLFINAVRPLEAKDLSTLFEVDFSPLGSNKRQLENKTVCFWRDWLIDVEEGDCNSLTLPMVLEFASGASSVPPLGFPHQPKIEFLHTSGQDTRVFPEANTCLIVLRLPIHSTYESFRTYMAEGILQSPTFGTM